MCLHKMAKSWIDIVVYVLIVSTTIQVMCNASQADTLSVVLDTDDGKINDHIDIQNIPDTMDNSRFITIKYMCAENRVVGVEIVLNVENRDKVKVFSKVWKCRKSSNIHFRDVKVRMPDWVAYRPDILNKESSIVSNAKMRAWVLDKDWWNITRKSGDSYARSLAKVSYDVCMEDPYSRPSKNVRGCKQWFLDYLVLNSIRSIPNCPYENGKVHIQSVLVNGETVAHLTDIILPKHQWIRLVLTVNAKQWTLAVNFGENFKEILETSASYDDMAYLDDTDGHFIVGGMESQTAFKGYVGRVTYYRLRAFKHTEIPLPSIYHPMFELGVMRREDRCKVFINRVEYLVYVLKRKKGKKTFKDRCTSYMYDILNNSTAEQRVDWCPISDFLKRKDYSEIKRLLKKGLKVGTDSFDRIKWNDIAQSLYEKATDLIDMNFKDIKKAVLLLKQAACHGNTDAMYMLSVILNNGFMIKSDEIQAHAYLMMASLGRHRLSSLSLGHKHMFGIDGVPFDKPQAYVYFKFVADKTNEDREIHKGTDVLTESVRLTDENQLSQQTDEEGDLFHWLKHQAKQGVSSAQQHVARTLFWGSQGLKRNVQEAINFFRMGAETKEPEAVYDYGILVFRGQGTDKNESEGLKHIQEAAESKHPPALNALGWYALTYDKNYSKAAEYFERAYKLGNVDAGFHLGYLHYHGLYPNQSQDVDKAWEYFNWAAANNQVFAGIMVAQLFMRGTSKSLSNQDMGVEWARYIAEQNPTLGGILRKGLQAYRHGNRSLAIFYYMMAAEAGIEVGSFNYAWLCEEDKGGFTNYIGKECQWKHFNLSVQRNAHTTDSYSLIKMGDYYWYGCQKTRETSKAADFYTKAAQKQDPQAIFNLAFMVEEGATLPESVFSSLRIERSIADDKTQLLIELYSRCRDSPKSEAYIPCTLSLWRIQLIDYWLKNNVWLTLSSVIGVVMAVVFAVYLFKEHYRNMPVDTYIF